MTTTHYAMRQIFKVQSGINQLSLPGIFSDYQAPIIRRQASGERDLLMARCSMPTPPTFPQEAHRPRGDERRNTSSP